jgi:hypothetical protein
LRSVPVEAGPHAALTCGRRSPLGGPEHGESAHL